MNTERPRILVVDDSEEMRTVLKKLLAGYDVTAAEDGAAGLRAAAEAPPPWCCWT
jgi:CheY-like chemotaxis protein